ncbi:72 kDa type IV collagenase [Desmophyllum pertusum]|uniref:72 kDa type IV collagenase n=1 Tax=Desmophyllum pertusum TaxID=174260 RepID=A0A9W9ZC24_9CNID|nr:72 kDa type IV collagenase [Desmophyllum pertusum]
MTAEDDRTWCSLTYDYEKDQQWGYCKDCSVRIMGGHHCCYFPFLYNGVLQTSCLQTPRPRGDFIRHKRWCSMYPDFDKKGVWKYCID